MRLLTLALLVVSLLSSSDTSLAVEDREANPIGAWRGELQRQPDSRLEPMQIVLRIRKGKDGQLTATFDGFGRNHRNLAVENLIVVEDVLSFQITQVQGRFAGNFSSVGDSVRGTWSERDESWPLILYRD